MCNKHYTAERDRQRNAAGYWKENEKRKKERGFYAQYWKQNVKAGIRRKASSTVNNAIGSGLLKRKPCEKCGEATTHAHHVSYLPEAWLAVVWLCKVHHNEWHKKYSPVYP